MRQTVKNLILGGGPGGIATALGMRADYLLIEKGSELGGFSTSLEMEGAVFDFGGHSFHTPHPEVRDLVFDAVEMYEQKRKATCLFEKQLISYPFQKNYHQLNSPVVVSECENQIPKSQNAISENYEDFILNRFGEGISKHFMLPYNRKLWGRDLSRLSASWTSERVAAPRGVEEKFDLQGGKRKPLQSDTKVAYPARGGFGEIFKALSKRLENVRCGQRIAKILPDKREVTLEAGHTINYERLVSTIPIPELLKLIDGVPMEIIEASHRLESLSLKLVLLVIDHPVDTSIQRIYSSESHIAAHKTAINHNSSDYLRSLKRHGIMAEVSYSDEKPLLRSDIERWVVENLIEMGIIKSEDEVLTTKVIDAKYAYPVPTLERPAIVGLIRNWLETKGVFLVGRFAEWDYINSDEVLYRGLKLGSELNH